MQTFNLTALLQVDRRELFHLAYGCTVFFFSFLLSDGRKRFLHWLYDYICTKRYTVNVKSGGRMNYGTHLISSVAYRWREEGACHLRFVAPSYRACTQRLLACLEKATSIYTHVCMGAHTSCRAFASGSSFYHTFGDIQPESFIFLCAKNAQLY